MASSHQAGVKLSREQLLERYGPRTDEEAEAMAKAVLDHRDQEEAIDQLEQLSEFEARLIERAYAEGFNDARRKIENALGPAAATADANALRRVLAPEQPMHGPWLGSHRGTLRATLPGPPYPRLFVDLRAARLVAGVRRALDAEAKSREAARAR
jgi:hypothetical protein